MEAGDALNYRVGEEGEKGEYVQAARVHWRLEGKARALLKDLLFKCHRIFLQMEILCQISLFNA